MEIPVIELNSLSHDDTAKVMTQISNNDPSVVSVDFTDVLEKYDDDYIRIKLKNEISNILAKNTTLKVLYIGSEVVKISALSVFLQNNHCLSELYLGYQRGDLSRLIDALISNTSLQLYLLNISENDYDLEGLKKLAQFLKINRSLRKIDLSFNSITNEGAMYLADALRYNPTIHELDLSDNYQLSPDLVNVINEMLNVNKFPSNYPSNQKEILFQPYQHQFNIMVEEGEDYPQTRDKRHRDH